MSEALSPKSESVTCPECGTPAVVTLNRRDATDFCRSCDYPLFWTPATVLRSAFDRSAEETLRRLPGTVGRATVASQPCPWCAEPNALSAQICVRCGQPMQRPEPPPPPPPPVYVAPEPEPVVVVPPPRRPWWVFVVLAIIVITTVVLVVLAATNNLG